MTEVYLGTLAELAAGATRGYQAAPDLSVFAVRHNDEVHVYRNLCPHAGTELNWMLDKFLDRDREYIQCSSHGALFEINTGLCIAGPCGGQHLDKLPSHVEDGNIYVHIKNMIEAEKN